MGAVSAAKTTLAVRQQAQMTTSDRGGMGAACRASDLAARNQPLHPPPFVWKLSSMRYLIVCAVALAAVLSAGAAGHEAVHLFTQKGPVTDGWSVRKWNDLTTVDKEGQWTVDENGVLHGSDPRGTWLMSDKEYSDFHLDLEFKLPPEGNSGVALRAPMRGDPAYDGMELQIVDPRYYNGQGEAFQLCGSIYRAIPPAKTVFKPEEWNKYEITCQGPHVKVVLNGQTIQDFNLDEQTKVLHRDDPKQESLPLKERPRKGHIGFQELSRGGHVQIRNVTLQVLDEK